MSSLWCLKEFIEFRQINACRQVPLQVNFKKIRHLGLESISYFVYDEPRRGIIL
jgi:hypothetical protein